MLSISFKCYIFRLDIMYFSYMLPQNETGMAMISVKIVSGFIPVKKSVERV